MRNIPFYILLFALFVSSANAQTTVVADAAFEQRLIQLGIDSDGLINGQILNSDAIGITKLDVKASNISDLTGIEAFVNLDTLDCSQNKLTNLNVSYNTALVALMCNDNQLTNLALNYNLVLDYLICNNNNLAQLNLGNALTLTSTMDCRQNLANLKICLDTGRQNINPFYVNGHGITALPNGVSCTFTPLLNGSHVVITGPVSTMELQGFELGIDNLCINELGNSLTQCLDFEDTTFVINTPTTQVTYGLPFYVKNGLSFRTKYDDPSMMGLIGDVNIEDHVTAGYIGTNGATSFANNIFYQGAVITEIDVSGFSLNNVNIEFDVNQLPKAINAPNWMTDPTAYYSTDCYAKRVIGTVKIDNNSNCIAEATEDGRKNQVLKFERLLDNEVAYYTTYDSLGNYEAYLDTGVYEVSLVQSNLYWQSCLPTQQITINAGNALQVLDWSVQKNVLCPYLEVDVSAPLLRKTASSAYSISYCNSGTIVAQNAYVEVDLDDDLNFISATKPVVNQIGTVYTFNVGNVAIGECDRFEIQVIVDSSAQYEQTHCTEVHMYPDSICQPTWSGARVGGHVNCQNQNVVFTLENKGASMALPQKYTIFEDNIAMLIDVIQIGGGLSTDVIQAAAPGHTYRIEVEQEPGFPKALGGPIFSRVLEGCNPFANGSFNNGFVTQFSNGNSAPFIAIDCQPNVGSYDPNDKSAQPIGYGTPHYIEQNSAIDYKIRFQNTGTDTAFNIVIVDTLSPYVDVASLAMGASSHSYHWSIEDGRVLRVVFPNILLVDSNANEPLSHGFFRYRIEQENNNAIGTVIENQAAIYFDYNLPIFTNTTFHTIGENFITSTVSVDKYYKEAIEVTVFPNPFSDVTTLEIKGEEYHQLELSIVDISGRLVKEKVVYNSNQIKWARGNLPAGVYLYQLRGNEALLSTGKVIIH